MSLLFQPMPLQTRPSPFDDANWIFELKYDGFRALAVVAHGRSQFVSRNGNPLASFADLAQDVATAGLKTRLTVLDGEIVCVDTKGKPQFRDDHLQHLKVLRAIARCRTAALADISMSASTAATVRPSPTTAVGTGTAQR